MIITTEQLSTHTNGFDFCFRGRLQWHDNRNCDTFSYVSDYRFTHPALVFCGAQPVDVRWFAVPRIDFVDHVAIIVGAFPQWADAAGAELDIGAIGLTAK